MTQGNPDHGLTPPPILRDRSEAALAARSRTLAHIQYCQRICAEQLVYTAAHQSNEMDVDMAWEVLKLLPVEALSHLDTPAGWATLIDQLRQVLGIVGPAPVVTIH